MYGDVIKNPRCYGGFQRLLVTLVGILEMLFGIPKFFLYFAFGFAFQAFGLLFFAANCFTHGALGFACCGFDRS